MSRPQALGVRRRCLSCASAFYDLGRTPIVCPKCGVEFTVIELPRRSEPYKKYGSAFVRPVAAAPEAPTAAQEDADAEADEGLLVRDDEDDEAPASEDAEPSAD
jgi:uncharacterized protein (TIGR02300 family)